MIAHALFYFLVSLVAVAVLWGATNPFIRRGSQGVEKIKANGKIIQILLELKFLITTWQVRVFKI